MGEDALIAAVLAEDSERQDSWKVFFFCWLVVTLSRFKASNIVGGGNKK